MGGRGVPPGHAELLPDRRTAIAERIRNRIASHPFDLGGGRVIHCTCSIGFAFYPVIGGRPTSFAWESVVDMADRCLMAAKRSGRNAWIGLAAPEDADPDQLKRRLPADLADLVRSGLLRVTPRRSRRDRLGRVARSLRNRNPEI